MNPFALSGLLTFISSFTFGIFSWVKGKRFLNKIWAIFNLSVAIWGFSAFKFASTLDQDAVFFWLRFGHIGVIFIPVLFLHFVFELLETKKRKIIQLVYIIGIFFTILNFTDWFGVTRVFIVSLRYVFDSFYVDSPPGLIYPIFVIFFFGSVIYAHYHAFRYLRISSGLKRMQIKYFLLATALGFGGGGTAFPMVFNIDIYPILHFTVCIYPVIMTYAIFKYRLMDIKVAITRAGIFLVVYTFVLGIPFWLGYQTRSWFMPTSLAVVLATIGPFIYRRLQQKAEDILLAKQKHYQKLLLQAATGMVREHNLERLLKLIVHVVKRAVKIEFAAIFLVDKENNRYILKTIRDYGAFPKDLSFPYEHPVIKLIRQKRMPVSYEEIGSLFKEPLSQPIHLIVPCFMDDKLLGFLALGEKKDRTFYTQDDINVFEILSRQTALAVEYCMFLEEFKKGQEKIFTAEKLASIGGMASGVAHQIRNRLDVFGSHADKQRFKIEDFIKDYPQLIEQNPELKKVLDYLIEEADGIENNVQRCGQLITGVLKFAGTQQMEAGFSEFSLKEVIELCISPLKAKHSIIGELPFDLEIELGNDDTLYASKGQMTEVMFNSIDNGYEAIEELRLYLNDEEKKNYRPYIRIELHNTGNSHIIKISDNGIGIKEENRLKIFSPYFTTKSSTISGTGIGMYVIKRLIEENHKGKIHFESTYKKGTTFFIELPKTKRGR